MSRFSSSAAIISRPVVEPWPSSIIPSFTDAVLSPWIASQESSCCESYGPFEANGSSAAFAAFAPKTAPTVENATISAPPPLRNVLRESSRSCRKPVTLLPSLRHHGGGLLDRRQDARIGATTAEMAVHGGADLVLGRVLRRRQKIGGLDHHAVLAVAAMRHLHVDPRLLQRMQRRRSRRRTPLLRPQGRQALERRDRLAGDRSHRSDARADLLAVQQHRARAALRETAAEARAVQMQLVVQDVEQRSVKARGHAVHETVHLDLELARQ